ncbi:hypothetical protein ACFLS4_06700 [Bacteroidota bacterium]
MKNIIIYAILLSLIFTSCNGQENKDIKKYFENNEPQTDIKVNKEYDENGNLIKYDSTYSYYYSTVENDPLLRDSIFNEFRISFNEMYHFSEDPFFDNLFFQDTLLDFDFYSKDFFMNRFQNNRNRMNQLFLEMDSIKNLFLMNNFKMLLKIMNNAA